ncbi:hypothetical protein M2272_004268 [Mycobacterium frederiksbergense]|uniref:PE-PGRS family protein n=1 Tax=Mycolicibacterium frederiksbergense TaxID=117567 RepID=A0ABT6L3X1_9MYCO|nr:hypothetical protein [Mycolicibacterium frederiksbergense]MDH6197613.1 hypothetical protein [Mycolicibacterium frederiksbergense]
MQVAARSYLTAGVALVGAGAIAVSPLAPPAPDIHLPAIHASSAAVALTAQADPLAAWAEVIGTAVQNIQGLGQQWAADPAPILTQIIANQLHSANALGAAMQTTIDGFKEALAPDGFMSFPAAFRSALDLIAAGDFENGFGGVVTSALLLALPIQMGVGQAWPVIAQPFLNLGQLVLHLNDNVPALLVNGMVTPLWATATAAGHSLTTLVNAVKSGDLAEFASALLTAPATITGALLNGYDIDGYHAVGLLSPAQGWVPGGAIATAISAIAGIANSIKTPGADRHNLFGNLPGLGLTAPQKAGTSNLALESAGTSNLALESAGSTTVTLTVAPQTTAGTQEAAPARTSPAQAASAEAPAESASADTPVKSDPAKVSLKAEPGKTGTLAPKRPSAVNQVREGIQGSVKSMTDSVKKAAEGLSGKSTKADKSDAAKSGGESSSSS